MNTESESPNAAQIKPTADASELIDQISKPYREQPWAVIRELFQNASDAIQINEDTELKLIELAILSRDTKPSPDIFHIVIRDSGLGMSDVDMQQYLSVLGAGSKKGVANLIGQFGVGFFATHAICLCVRIISRKKGDPNPIGWDYIPNLKMFYKLQLTTIERQLSIDYERHPDPTRRRTHGTSVYLNIDLAHHPSCHDWLVAEELVNRIRRDFFILPAPIVLGDYSDGFPGRAIIDNSGLEVQESELNFSQAPWEAEGAARSEIALRLLKFRSVAETEGGHDPDWCVITKSIGHAQINGFLWINGTKGRPPTVDLLLKRMWVESAKDIHPGITMPATGIFDIKPNRNDLDIDISPQRDHLIRDNAFRIARREMQSGLVDLFENAGIRCAQQIKDAVLSQNDIASKISAAKEITAMSSFATELRHGRISFASLLTEVPGLVAQQFREREDLAALLDGTLAYVNRRISPAVGSRELVSALVAMQERADEREKTDDLAVTREPLQWTPNKTKEFIERVGPFFPVPLAMRERRTDGGFNVIRLSVPLSAVVALNPSSATKIVVLVKGSVIDYFSKQTTIGSVIEPAQIKAEDDERASFCLLLSVVSAICGGIPKLEFMEHRRELLNAIVNPDDWIPLIECFSSIVNTSEERGGRDSLQVDALGFQGDKSIPLLYDLHNSGQRLIINAYNALMQDILPAYVSAGERNDTEVRELITQICHELYHHSLPVEHEPTSYDKHAVVTRNLVFQQTLSMLRKYADVRQ